MYRFLILATIVIASCNNCEKYTKNYVVDKETRKPVFGVWVFSVAATDGKQELEKWTHTDSLGAFEAMYKKEGTGKCPILKLTLSKEGYYPLSVWDPIVGDTIAITRMIN